MPSLLFFLDFASLGFIETDRFWVFSGVLSDKKKDYGKVCPIYLASHAMTAQKRRHSVNESKELAVVFKLTDFRIYPLSEEPFAV